MLDYLSTVLPEIFPLVGAVFSFVFMGIVLYTLITALRHNRVQNLFVDNYDGEISVTKFWQNIAYAASTVAFLSVNLGNKTNFPIEIIWVIYLGTVASNAVLSKWISAKYQGAPDDSGRDDGYYSGGYRDNYHYRRKENRRASNTEGTGGAVDDPDA